MAAFKLLRIVLERQISGLCFWLYSPLHAPVVGIHDKKALLVSPAFTWALLLIWVLKGGSWRAAYPCSIQLQLEVSQCMLVIELLPRHAHTKHGIWEQRSRFPLQCFLLAQDSAGKMKSTTCMVFFLPASPTQSKWSCYHEVEGQLFPIKCLYHFEMMVLSLVD